MEFEKSKTPEFDDNDINNIAKKVFELVGKKEPNPKLFDEQIQKLIKKLSRTPYTIEKEEKQKQNDFINNKLYKSQELVKNVINESTKNPIVKEMRLEIEKKLSGDEDSQKPIFYRKPDTKWFFDDLLDIFQVFGIIDIKIIEVTNSKFINIQTILQLQSQNVKTFFLSFSKNEIYWYINDQEILEVLESAKSIENLADESRFYGYRYIERYALKRIDDKSKSDYFKKSGITDDYQVFCGYCSDNESYLTIFAYCLFKKFGMITEDIFNDLV